MGLFERRVGPHVPGKLDKDMLIRRIKVVRFADNVDVTAPG
jgi:hypothetical protein